MSDWKRCPKCKCMNLNRESCVDCGLELKDVEAMSTEPNTQRPAPSMEQQGRTAPDLKYTELPPETQRLKCGYCDGKGYIGLDDCPDCTPDRPPKPETGAVDVEKLVEAAWREGLSTGLCTDNYYPDEWWPKSKAFKAIAPLTARISQLEAECRAWEQSTRDMHALMAENERLKCDLNWQNNRNSGYPTKGGFEFYINEEWTGLATAALGADCGWCAALRKHRIDPDDERVRVRRVIEDDAILNKLAAAEARIQELEQKLEAALKLTTEQSINNMRSKA